MIDERFRVQETKYRWSVLKDGSRAKDWLAMVLVITWRVRNGPNSAPRFAKTAFALDFERGELTCPNQVVMAFRPGGTSGIQVSDLFPEVRKLADELCVIRSIHADKLWSRASRRWALGRSPGPRPRMP